MAGLIFPVAFHVLLINVRLGIDMVQRHLNKPVPSMSL